MPGASYLLMALEAARQIRDIRENDADSLRISSVHFERRLPLSVFSRADTAVESQLLARRIDDSNKFAFEIFFQNSADEDSWTRHCYGNLETQVLAESPSLSHQKLIHDQALLDQARGFQKSIGAGLSHLKLSLEGSYGEFEHSSDDFENYVLHPQVLHSILNLPPMSILSQNLPAERDLCSVTSITVPFLPLSSSCGHFTARVWPSEFCNVQSDIEISQSKGIVSLKGLKYQATRLISQKPARDSLFFKPVLLPNIERLSATAPMSISRCLELLTHKWPMCDIKIINVPERYTLSILESFGAVDQTRSFYRSIKCTSIPAGVISDRIQPLDGCDPATKYHMVITQEDPSGGHLSQHLHSGGLLCITKTHLHDLKSNQSSSLEFICDITGLGPDPWVMLHKSKDPGPFITSRRAVIFSNHCSVPSFDAFERAESVLLEPEAVARFCEPKSMARFDAIVIDSQEKSVIATWKGAALMPWLQALLKSADSILWVTRTSNENPFAKIVGGLLRTLQSEQPSLNVSWLVMEEKDEDTLARQVEEAFARMIGGENELVTKTGGSGPEILRYLPDDDLSAATGLSLPRRVKSPVGETDYSLGFAAPEEPVILSRNASTTESSSENALKVLVEASVIETDHLQMFNGKNEVEVSLPPAGLFFAGRVVNSRHPKVFLESRVVGWHPNHNHRRSLDVQYSDICQYSSSMQPSYAASRYAAIATASCIVDGTARAHQGETFLLNLPRSLLITTKQLCERVGATVLSPCSRSIADFIVTFNCLKGILVNRRPVHIARYLQSEHGRTMVQQHWENAADLSLQIDHYEIPN